MAMSNLYFVALQVRDFEAMFWRACNSIWSSGGSNVSNPRPAMRSIRMVSPSRLRTACSW